MKSKKIEKIELKAQYRILSEIEGLWGVKPSKHRAYVLINNKMKSILKQLEQLKT